MQQKRGFIKPFEVTVEMSTRAAPDVAVGFEFENGRFFDEGSTPVAGRVGVVGDLRGEGKVRAGIEGRINVNQIDFPANSGSKEGSTYFLSPQTRRLRYSLWPLSAKSERVRWRSSVLSLTVSMV